MRCRRDAVRRAIWHSWAAYKRHAWQADDLQPISRTGLDWNHAESTIFDALDTLALAGFKAEFEATAAYIRRHGPPLVGPRARGDGVSPRGGHVAGQGDGGVCAHLVACPPPWSTHGFFYQRGVPHF